MKEEHKEKLRQARAAAREARRNAVDAEIDTEKTVKYDPVREHQILKEEQSEADSLRAELAALKERYREKAAHEHETISGRERISTPDGLGGAQADVQESLRRLLREELATTFPEREPIRHTARESQRPGAVVALGRDGQPLYRKRDQVSDPFALPEDLMEPGWSYQWCRVSVHGQEDTNHQVELQEQGWRFVQADSDRFRGRMMPASYKGPIYRDGLALMERPAVLTEEAKREAARKVRQQSQSQRQQFGLALPEGFSSDTPGAQRNTFARHGAPEPTPSTLRPNLDNRVMDIDS